MKNKAKRVGPGFYKCVLFYNLKWGDSVQYKDSIFIITFFYSDISPI